jgi:Uma2 family endonuclease
MGMPASKQRRWTRTEVVGLIEQSPLGTPRYELVDGDLLVTPSPSGLHQIGVVELICVLAPYVAASRIGQVLTSPSDTELEPETLVQPDVYVVPVVEAQRLRRERIGRSLLLAIELLSPSSERSDRDRKRRLYQRTVPEYWMVDLHARVVERWGAQATKAEVVREVLEWHPAGAATPLSLDLPAFFARVHGES